jgi:heptosyltransferase-2
VNILIRATNWIGDAVMSLPALRAVRARFPAAQISVLAKPWVAALYEGERAITRVIPFETRWQAIRSLRAGHFDLGILLPNSFDSAVALRLGGVRRIVGYARDARSLLLSDAIPVPRPGEIPRHERFYYLELLRRAQLIDSIPDVPEIRLDALEEKRRRGQSAFTSAGIPLPVIGVSPGAAYGSAKRWLPERFAEAAQRLAADIGGSVAVFGSAAEKALCASVAGKAGARSFAGETSLRTFIDMAAACSLFLTNDSGAMHIAAAAGVPSVTVFGPTDENATGPLGEAAVRLRHPVECAPCLRRECPIDHRCMTRVTVEDVILAGHAAISRVARGAKNAADSRISSPRQD